MTGPAERLGAETLDAGRSVLRLLRFDPDWAERLDLTTDGFLRSFWAPLLALPLNLVAIHAWSHSQGVTGPQASLLGTTIAQLIDAAAFPLVLAAIAKPTGIARGYAALVILTNWAGLLLNAVLAGAAVLLLDLGHAPTAFSLAAKLLSLASVYALWRAGRETVGRETEGPGSFAPVLMVVVLAVGIDAAASQLGVWLSS